MNNQERNLQRELERIADEAKLRPGLFELTQQRAQRRRSLAVTASAAALVTVAIVATLVVPRGGERDDLASPEIQPGLVRLLTEPRGLLEIEASKGELCYRFEMRGVTDTKIVNRATGDTALQLEATDYSGAGMVGCQRDIDPVSLNSVAREPDRYLIRFENSLSGGTSETELRLDEGAPTCYRTPASSGAYTVHLSKTEGMPGEAIHVWGPTFRDQAGAYAPTERFELWWNSRTPDGLQPIAEGDAVRLLSSDTRYRCYFQAVFEVPDAAEGTYRMTGFVFEQPANEGYGVLPGPRFTVTSDHHTREQGRVCANVEGDGFFTSLDIDLAAGLPVTRADAARKAVRLTRPRTMSNTTRTVTFGCYHPPPLASGTSSPIASWPAWRVDFRGVFRFSGRCVRGWQIILHAETSKVLSSGTKNRSINCNAELRQGIE